MTLPRLLWLLPVTSALACVPPTKPLGGDGDDSEGGGDGDGSMTSGADDGDPSASGQSSATAGGEESTGSAGSAGSSDGPTPGTTSDATGDGETSGDTTGDCEPLKCELCPVECENMSGCVDGEYVCECVCSPTDDTGNPMVCDMEQTACDLADFSKVVPIDCGIATLDDDLETWQEVHDCAQTNAAMQQGFKAVFDLQGIDSFPRRAYVGQVGFAYSLSQLDQDLGGLGDPQATISRQGCMGLTFLPDCSVGVGFTCLQCLGTGGDPEVLCQE